MSQQPQRDPDPWILVVCGLVILMGSILIVRVERVKIKNELDETRRQRARLEGEVDKLEGQRDQLLEELHPKKTDDGPKQPGTPARAPARRGGK